MTVLLYHKYSTVTPFIFRNVVKLEDEARIIRLFFSDGAYREFSKNWTYQIEEFGR